MYVQCVQMMASYIHTHALAQHKLSLAWRQRRCDYDDGDCKGQPPRARCQDFGSCVDCLTSDTECGWCAAVGKCMDGNAGGPTFGTCPSERWFLSQCYASSPQVNITYPISGAVLQAGKTYNVTWSGGLKEDGNMMRLQLRYGSMTTMISGYGLPTGIGCQACINMNMHVSCSHRVHGLLMKGPQ